MVSHRKWLEGFRVVRYNFFNLILTVILGLGMIFVSVSVAHLYDKLDVTTNDFLQLQENSIMVGEASDYLTDQVRFFAHDFNIEHVHLYFQEADVTKRRDKVLEQVHKETIHSTTAELLASAISESNNLMKIEFYSMALICHVKNIPQELIPSKVQEVSLTQEDLKLSQRDKIDKAQSILFDKQYMDSKKFIMTHVDRALKEILQNHSQKKKELTVLLREIIIVLRVFIGLFLFSSAVSAALMGLMVMRPLRIFMGRLTRHQNLDEIGGYETRHLAKVFNYIYAAKDAGEERESHLRYESEHDPLTGLLNRKVFAQLGELLKGHQGPMVLLIIDMDKFKSVNDKNGHAIGDLALIKLSDLLKSQFRIHDYIFRVGGDEFVVVVPGLSEKNFSLIQEKIIFVNNALQSTEDGLPPLSISAGMSVSYQGYTDLVFREADKALYAAKSKGRKMLELYQGTFHNERVD